MNERIRKLAKKSGFSLDANHIYTAKLEHLPITENMEKFAELIVQECIRKIEDIAESSNNPQPIYRVAVELLEHFGVEE